MSHFKVALVESKPECTIYLSNRLGLEPILCGSCHPRKRLSLNYHTTWSLRRATPVCCLLFAVAVSAGMATQRAKRRKRGSRR